MNDLPLANLLVTALGGCLTILICLLGWIGSRVHSKIDDLTSTVNSGMKEMNTTLVSIEKDLRGELVKLDRRVSKMEDTIPPSWGIHHRDLS